MRYLKLVMIVAALALSAAAYPILAAEQNELTFSASLFNPNDGPTVFTGTGEFLIPIGGGAFMLGPSLSLFDGGDFEGGEYGVAAELNVGGKTCGPGLGGAVHVPTGDAADLVDYTYQARAFFKCGSAHAFSKLMASQVWSKAEDGATTEPDGTRFTAGIGWRF